MFMTKTGAEQEVSVSEQQGSQERRKTELLDDLAKIEHEQWKSWAYALMDTETLSKSRTERWLKNHGKQWDEFSEEDKNKDREWAERVLWVLKKHLGIK